MKLFKKISYMVCFFVFLNAVSAAVSINEFVVDPQQDWDNSGTVTVSDEWFELYNNGNNIDISGWKLELIDTTNETEVLEGVINAGSYFVILNPAGQQNNEGQLKLYDSDNNLIDSVTYGNYDDGNLGDNEPDGNADSIDNECLAKIGEEFMQKKCTKGYSNGVEKGSSVSFLINAIIDNSAPIIYSIAISPDDSGEKGIQVSPIPSLNKTIEITAFASNSDYVRADIFKKNISIYRKKLDFIEEENSTKKYYGTIGMRSTNSAGNYTVKVTASNSEGNATLLDYFEYLGLIGIEVDSVSLTFSDLKRGETSYIIGDLNMSTPSKPTIKNIGNIVINAEISGTDLTQGNKSIPIENLKFRFGNSGYLPFSADPTINKLNLGIGSRINLDLGLSVPEEVASGSYRGALLITALS